MSKLLTHHKRKRGMSNMKQNHMLNQMFFRKRNRSNHAKALQINTPNKIVESRYVPIGGIDQWITIRGEDRSNPILLFIHGGPASPYSIFSPLLRAWEKHFTVVQWDQRGAGKTFGLNGKEGSGTITFDLLAADGIEVTEYLLGKLGHSKLILIGSSVGSLIGVRMAQHRPALFYAYVGTDQNVPGHPDRMYEISLQAVRAAGNAKGVKLLEKMGPDPSSWSRHDYDKRNRVLVKSIQNVPNMITDLIMPSMLSSPEHQIRDMMDIFKGMSFTLGHLFHEMMRMDFTKEGMRFELPVFIFQGDSDIITPTELAKTFYDELQAPRKEFALIRSAGHLACFARADQFLEELITRVRPLAVPAAWAQKDIPIPV